MMDSSLVVIIWDVQAATIGASSLLSRLGEVKGKQYDLGMTERSIRYCYLAINHYRQRNDDAVVNEVCHVFWQFRGSSVVDVCDYHNVLC